MFPKHFEKIHYRLFVNLLFYVGSCSLRHLAFGLKQVMCVTLCCRFTCSADSLLLFNLFFYGKQSDLSK